MMERTITVKGEGRIRRRPDQVEIGLRLESIEEDYARAMSRAADASGRLKDALVKTGLDRTKVKTSAFQVTTRYRGETDPAGRYIEVFEGYVVLHSLRIELAMDQAVLSRVLQAVALTDTRPHIEIRFGIKDPTQVTDELLQDASQNARRKAGILAESSGVRLGQLVKIDYNWSDARFFSDTVYQLQDRMQMKEASVPEIEPDEISLTDTAVFVWEMV